VLTYEDRTQNYDPEVHEEHPTHPFPCHIVQPDEECADFNLENTNKRN